MSTSPSPSPAARGTGALVGGALPIFGACLLWALDTLIRYPLLFSGRSAWTIVWLEHAFLVAAMLWWLVPLARSGRLDAQALLGFLVIGGLGSGLGTVAFTQAFALINPSVVILIQKLQPIVAVLLAALILGERVGVRFVAWLAICLAGSAMIAWPDLAPALDPASWGGTESRALLLGYGFTLFAVFAWGASTVLGKRLGNSGFSPTELMAGRFAAGFVVLTPLVFAFGEPAQASDPEMLGKVALMVLISGLAALWLYYQGMRRLPARAVAVAEMAFPIAAVAVNWVALGKALEPMQVAGAVVLLGGSTMVALTQIDDSRGDDAVLDRAATSG